MEVGRLLLLPPCCNLLHLTLDFEAEFYTACYPNIGLRAAIAAHIHSVAAYELKTLSHADDKLNDTITERLDNTIQSTEHLYPSQPSQAGQQPPLSSYISPCFFSPLTFPFPGVWRSSGRNCTLNIKRINFWYCEWNFYHAENYIFGKHSEQLSTAVSRKLL